MRRIETPIAGIPIPDSALAREATDCVREESTRQAGNRHRNNAVRHSRNDGARLHETQRVRRHPELSLRDLTRPCPHSGYHRRVFWLSCGAALAATLAVASPAMAAEISSGSNRLSVTATQDGRNFLRLQVRARLTAQQRSHDVDCHVAGEIGPPRLAPGAPAILPCGPSPATRSLNLRKGSNRMRFTMRVTQTTYQRVPNGAGLAPYQQKTVASPIDTAYVSVTIAGRQVFPRLLSVQPG